MQWFGFLKTLWRRDFIFWVPIGATDTVADQRPHMEQHDDKDDEIK